MITAGIGELVLRRARASGSTVVAPADAVLHLEDGVVTKTAQVAGV